MLQKYLEAINGAENLGPYRAQAVFDIFQTSIIDQVQTLSHSIEKVQQGGIDKAQALLSEYQRQERSLQDLVNFQKEKMQQQDQESQEIQAEKAAQEAQLEETNRKLKELMEKMDKTNELNEIDLKNLKNNGERQVLERNMNVQTMEQEIEGLEEQVRQAKEKVHRVQN